MDWGRIGAGIVTGGLSEGARLAGFRPGGMFDPQARANNEFRDINQSNFDLPNLGEQYGHYSGLQSYYRQRQAPQAQSYTSADSNFRNNQTQLGQMLMAQAQGRGPGQDVVRMQAQNMGNRAVAQQMAMANSGRPGMGSMGYRNAAMNAANAQSAVGGQAALGGLQAQLGAMDQYGGFLQGARGQDLQRNMFNAQQQQQGGQFNADAQLRMYGLNDQAQLEALRQRLAATQMQQQGGMGYENARTQRFNAMLGVPTYGEALLNTGADLGGALIRGG